MSAKSLIRYLLSFLVLLTAGCYHPPYNHFQPYRSAPANTAKGAAIGTVAGVVASQASNAFIPGGAIAGGLIGAGVSLYHDSKPGILGDLQKMDIQFVEYGDTKTLIVPTDRYFVFNSATLNDVCYPGLRAIVKLLKLYPNSTIYVAGFTDNVGSLSHKKQLSTAQAEAMLTYLWANGISARRLMAEGYGEQFAVSDNQLIHGSAQNRRLEIQWFNAIKPKGNLLAMVGYTK